jgi:hypothetical protein
MDMKLSLTQSEVVKQFPSFRSNRPDEREGNIRQKLPWSHRALTENSTICRFKQLGSSMTKELLELKS